MIIATAKMIISEISWFLKCPASSRIIAECRLLFPMNQGLNTQIRRIDWSRPTPATTTSSAGGPPPTPVNHHFGATSTAPPRDDIVLPFLLVDGHISRLDPAFLEYINGEGHKWKVCFGVPCGTSHWQVTIQVSRMQPLRVVSRMQKRNCCQ